MTLKQRARLSADRHDILKSLDIMQREYDKIHGIIKGQDKWMRELMVTQWEMGNTKELLKAMSNRTLAYKPMATSL